MTTKILFERTAFDIDLRNLRGTTVRWLSNRARQIEGFYNRHRQRHQLMTLDDRLLKDIGISRTDALKEGEKPFWKS
ncbi:MAG: DUF1127 domain-containing protein [Gammaproteobacteria bacterium]|nr:DUF1127 domain-containing protein [Gammaproteobacteria bacterium]